MDPNPITASHPSQSPPHTHHVDGAINFRAFGGYPSSVHPGARIKAGLIYRTGHLSGITPSGWKTLRELRISTIIRLTSAEEAYSEHYSNGVNYTDHLNDFKILEVRSRFLKKRLRRNSYSPNTGRMHLTVPMFELAQEYISLLQEGTDVIRTILLHIRDNPGEACLIHCSLGKDRTVIVFAILLSLAGVSRDVVAAEYSLSQEALQPLLPRLFILVQEAGPPGLEDDECQRIVHEVVETRYVAVCG